MKNVFMLAFIFLLRNGKMHFSIEPMAFVLSRFLETLVQYRIQPFQEYQISP